MRLGNALPRLRRKKWVRLLECCFYQGAKRTGMRLIHYSIQTNHLHLIIEAGSARALSRGMQGLAIRIAKRINLELGRRKGQVFADRYHHRLLKTPSEVRAALCYVLNNARRHGIDADRSWLDPYSSAQYFDGWRGIRIKPPPKEAPVVAADTWLLTTGWRRRGLLQTDETPGPAARNAKGRSSRRTLDHN